MRLLVIEKAGSIQNSVHSSHRERLETRKSFTAIWEEQVGTRQLLNEDALTGH